MDNSVKKLLPARVSEALDKLDESKIYEIRLRASGVSINYGGRFLALGDGPVTVTLAEIEEVVLRASGRSIYAVNDQIKDGFLSLNNGVRIGICGEVVSGKTIKNFTSLNIRFPHEVRGCADKVMRYVLRGRGCYNTIVVSPPGFGKTTLLRDMIRQISDRNNNVLVADERYELAGLGGTTFDLGRNTDVLAGCDKSFAFSRGIRYMRPDVLAADEIVSEEDVAAVSKACAGGVNVIATVHASGSDYKRRLGRTDFVERIVVLSSLGEPGRIEGVYDGSYSRLL